MTTIEMCSFVVNTVPDNALALLGAKASGSIVMMEFGSYIYVCVCVG